jgi:hypothetical protein
VKPSRLALWIPCVLGALALNALIFMPRASDLAEQPKARDPQPDFQLRFSPSLTKSTDQVEPPLTADQEAAFRTTRSEITRAGTDHPLAGSYSRDAHFHGSYRQLLLGTRSYVLVLVQFGSPKPVPASSDMIEWGSVTVEQDRIRIHARTERQDSELPRELAWVRAGKRSWLASIEMVPAAFYAGDELDSPFASARECGYARDGEPTFGDALPEVPRCYTEERERSAHLQVISLVPPASEKNCWLVRLGPGENAAVSPGQTLYWDAEERTHVRAVVRECGAGGVVACLLVPDCMSPGAVSLGTTFSRLPRLE